MAVLKTWPHTEAPQLLKYEGKRDPKLIHEFLWYLECYLNDMGVKDDKSKIDTVILYLCENDALGWMRNITT